MKLSDVTFNMVEGGLMPTTNPLNLCEIVSPRIHEMNTKELIALYGDCLCNVIDRNVVIIDPDFLIKRSQELINK